METLEYHAIAAAITQATGARFRTYTAHPVAGGCINAAVVLRGDDQRYFVKLNSAARVDMYAAEAAGLNELAAAGAVRVPRPVCWGTAGERAYLALEFIDFGGNADAGQERFGRALARLHRTVQPRFGWYRDNTIGATRQPNTPLADWVEFWRRHRLGYQLELAVERGYARRLQKRGLLLLERLPAFFAGHRPAASLLHGDLWSGNYAVTLNGDPVIFDPAVYYGDREADLAMTELFGGFSGRFYDAYRAEWPIDAGYSVRRTLYNLYHVLNHLNLFGGSYLPQAEHMLDSLLSATR